MSAAFPPESYTYQLPLGASALPYNQGGIPRDYEDISPKREMFGDIDLRHIPISGLPDPLEGLGLTSFDGVAPRDQATTDVGHPSSSSSPYPDHQRSRASMDFQINRPPHRSSVSTVSTARSKDTDPDGDRSPGMMHSSPPKRKSVSSASKSSPRSPLSAAGSYPRKTTHNMVEKRYRTNLNEKILALRDAVPSLRVVARRGSEALLDDVTQLGEAEDLGGLAPAHKLNKATVLSKATEYIAYLEHNNASLVGENNHLRRRVAELEMMVSGRAYGLRGPWG